MESATWCLPPIFVPTVRNLSDLVITSRFHCSTLPTYFIRLSHCFYFIYYQFIPLSMFISLYLHSIYSTYPLLLWYILISDTRQHRQVRMTLPHLFYSAVTLLYENFNVCYMHALLVFPVVLWIFFGDLPPVILYSDKQYVYNAFWLHWIHSLLILYYYHLILPSMFISLYLHSIYSTYPLLLLYILIPGPLQHRQVRMTPPHLFIYCDVTTLYETVTCVICTHVCVFIPPFAYVYSYI